MMTIRAAKQRRNGIAEPRSGRSDGEGEREQRRNGGAGVGAATERGSGSGSERSIHPPSIPDIIRRATIHNIHTIRVRDIARIDIGRFANILLK